jgi:hypothetical protein
MYGLLLKNPGTIVLNIMDSSKFVGLEKGLHGMMSDSNYVSK